MLPAEPFHVDAKSIVFHGLLTSYLTLLTKDFRRNVIDKPDVFIYTDTKIRKLIGAGRKTQVHRGAGNFPAILFKDIHRYME